jgi:CRP-like cAMP-binding protein
LPAGATVLVEGEESGALHVLLNGAVAVRRVDVRVAVISDPGAVFGEMSLLLGCAHTATVETLQPSIFAVAADGRALLATNTELTLAVAQLAHRLELVTTYLADLREQYGGGEENLSMIDAVLDRLVIDAARRAEPGSDRDPDPEM